MDWTATVIAVIAGVGSGFLSALASPFAQRRAEEAKARTTARRVVVSGGRQLVSEARREEWSPVLIAHDLRYMALIPHLSETVRQKYDVNTRTLYVEIGGALRHPALAAEIDDLERRWNLI